MKKTTTNIEFLKKVINTPELRQEISQQNHFWFFHTYFNHYVIYPPSDFHKEIFALTQRNDITNLVIVTFRGSGKSTIMNTSYPIWAIIGPKKKKFVLILSKTQEQAKQHINQQLLNK